jgi:hypothetical protein
MTLLPPDFKDFLKLLNSNEVEYLVVGGYAVGFHGYPRATADIDVWIKANIENAGKVAKALQEFGFSLSESPLDIFLQEKRVIRMGVPPLRIELLTSISGVNFTDCFSRRIVTKIDDIPVNIISLADLKTNKKTSGRHNDLNDLEHLA